MRRDETSRTRKAWYGYRLYSQIKYSQQRKRNIIFTLAKKKPGRDVNEDKANKHTLSKYPVYPRSHNNKKEGTFSRNPNVYNPEPRERWNKQNQHKEEGEISKGEGVEPNAKLNESIN